MPFPDPAHLTTLTFDCYGTLIDWETGAIASMRPLLLRHGIALPDEQIITEFQDIDAALCEPPYKPYRDVLAGVVEEFGRRFGFLGGSGPRDIGILGCFLATLPRYGARAASFGKPPGTSKWNKIEHRLISFITSNWRGKPLISHQAIVQLIGATTTKAGLKVRCQLDPMTYPAGISPTTNSLPSTSPAMNSTANGIIQSAQRPRALQR
jgi:hypothetical protein